MSLSKARAAEPPLIDDENTPLSPAGSSDAQTKYRAMRRQKFNKERGYGWIVTWMVFSIAWWLYVIYLAIAAALELTYVKPETFLPFYGWMWQLAVATFIQFFWFVLSISLAAVNAQAVSSNAAELPVPELRVSVSWHFVMFAVWGLAVGFMADLYAHRDPDNNPQQQTSFITKMWIVEMACLVTSIDPIRDFFRWLLDMMLVACKSPCYDF
jgi:hypothetical protein